MCITSSQGDMNTREKSSWNLSTTGILQIKASYNNIWPRLWLTSGKADKQVRKLSGQNKFRYYRNMQKKKKKKEIDVENDLKKPKDDIVRLG